MKTKTIINSGKILAIATLILGVIHDVATFTPLIKGELSCLNPANLNAMLYMSLICGTSLILSGILIYMLLKKVKEFVFLTTIILIIAIFLALNGMLAVLFMLDNPFAWITLILNLSLLVISVRLKIILT